MSANSLESIRIAYDTIRSFDTATFTGSYQNLGTALTFPAVIVKLVNNSDRFVTLSTDGTNDHDVFPIGAFTLYDYAANKSGKTLNVMAGTQYKIKGTASGTGLVYLVIQYLV